MTSPRILAFAGSVRRESFNRKLIALAADAAERAGASVTRLELRDYPLPLFDQDLESDQGPPERAVALKKLFLEHDGLLIASPEYNSSITPLLKNALDWVSRSAPGEPALAAFRGKAAGLVAASPSLLGGLRGLVHLRAILGNIQVLVLPDQATVPKADDAFDDAGRLKDPKRQVAVDAVGKALATTLARLKG